MKPKNNSEEDENWNEFIHEGNLESLSNIYFHYYDQLFAYGLNHSSDKQLVEDAIQDIFLNLIKVRKSIGEVKNLTGYLICTFRRQLFLDLNNQKKTRFTGLFPEEHFDFFDSSEDEISEKENLEQVHSTIKQCVSKLTDKQQEIIFLRFESEISYEEISEMLNISVDSCYKSVYRSIKTIRSEISKLPGKRGNIFLWFLSRVLI
jgi:RNA polymerase sigma factor (sigma-70 family)